MKKANDFGPSVLECLMAEKAFLKEYQRLAPCVTLTLQSNAGLPLYGRPRGNIRSSWKYRNARTKHLRRW